MRTTFSRPALLAVTAVATALAVTGCSAVQSLFDDDAPVRDEVSGQIVEAAEADAFQIRVGDCLGAYAEPDVETFEVQTVPTVPCAESHDGEVYAAHLLPDGSYPGEEEIFAVVDEVCYDAFEKFVGLAWDNSELDYTTLYPTPESWLQLDDREILCIVVDPAGEVSGSLKGSAR